MTIVVRQLLTSNYSLFQGRAVKFLYEYYKKFIFEIETGLRVSNFLSLIGSDSDIPFMFKS